MPKPDADWTVPTDTDDSPGDRFEEMAATALAAAAVDLAGRGWPREEITKLVSDALADAAGPVPL